MRPGFNDALRGLGAFQDEHPGTNAELGTVDMQSAVMPLAIHNVYMPMGPGVLLAGLQMELVSVLSGEQATAVILFDSVSLSALRRRVNRLQDRVPRGFDLYTLNRPTREEY